MTVRWLSFTPWRSLAGGALIGLAAAILVVANGRIAGISGILGGLLSPARNGWGWRLAFVAGLLAAPAVYALVAPLPVPRIEACTAMLVVAGLLVGFDTRLGSGCTSGHGARGAAR